MAPPAQFGGDGERAPLLNAPSASSRDASSSKSRFYAALAVLGACAVVAVAAVGTGACPPHRDPRDRPRDAAPPAPTHARPRDRRPPARPRGRARARATRSPGSHRISARDAVGL
jgi:hypothetical protein